MATKQEKVYEKLSTYVGEDVIPIVRYLENKKNISEFQIADKVKYEVNQTRNVLYRLHSHNIVTYHRKKDRIKGWYISYWTLNTKRIRDLLEEMKVKKIERLKEKLIKEEENRDSYFLCPNLCVRVDLDLATDFEFKCPECGTLLNQQDNTKTIDNIRNTILDLEKKLKKIRAQKKEIVVNIEEEPEKPAKKDKKKPKKKAVSKKEKVD